MDLCIWPHKTDIWSLRSEWDWMFPLTPLRPGSCYETAMTRKFYHGRTETMRPCTTEAVNWCRTMMDPTSDVSVCACNPVLWQTHSDEGGGSSLWLYDVTHKHFSVRLMPRGKPCCWPSKSTTHWWLKPRKEEVSSLYVHVIDNFTYHCSVVMPLFSSMEIIFPPPSLCR